jgi:hypothetical protein
MGMGVVPLLQMPPLVTAFGAGVFVAAGPGESFQVVSLV